MMRQAQRAAGNFRGYQRIPDGVWWERRTVSPPNTARLSVLPSRGLSQRSSEKRGTVFRSLCSSLIPVPKPLNPTLSSASGPPNCRFAKWKERFQPILPTAPTDTRGVISKDSWIAQRILRATGRAITFLPVMGGETGPWRDLN